MAIHFDTMRRRAYQKLWNKLDEHLLSLCARGVVLAISGGPDSRALLEAIATWKYRSVGRFLVVCIDHGLRKESAQEAIFIKQRAQRLGFNAHIERIDTGSMAEHSLRRLRYEALFHVARGHSMGAIACAHQSDDDAEGYVMALMGVGGGELGAAMTEVEHIDGMVLCRPFLTLSKNHLLLMLTLGNHTDFVRDSCDENRHGQRAFIRHDILPELAFYTPTIRTRLAQFGRAQAHQRRIVDKAAEHLIAWRPDSASVSLDPKPDHALLMSALWQIVKYFGDGKDLRAAGSLIASIAEEVVAEEILSNHAIAGLDPRLNGFNLKALSVKHYQVPGAVVLRAKSEIRVKRN